MRSEHEGAKHEEIERIVRRVRERVGGEERADAETFVRRYYAPLAPEDVAAREDAEAVAAPLSLWAFGRRRRPGEARVRLLNPQLDEHGWHSPRTVVEVVNDDMPFLVDSLTAELRRLGLDLHLVVHPVVEVRRDEEGERLGLTDGGAAPLAESTMHIEVGRESDARRRESIRDNLLEVLALVRAAVADWRPMTGRLQGVLEELDASPPPLPAAEAAEGAAFLAWLGQGHFTFLGSREYELGHSEGRTSLRAVEGSGLGVMRDELRPPRPGGRELSPEMLEYARRPELVFVTKSDSRARVHRPVHMDYVGIKRFDEAGEVRGEIRFMGLFTSLAYNRRASTVPLLRRKVARVMERAGFDPKSHDGKALAHILETFPRDELFQIPEDALLETSLGILQLQERSRLALFVRKDTFERFVSCLVFVPRDRFNTDLRLRMVEILEDAFGGELGAAYTQVGDQPLARLQVFLKTRPGKVRPYDVKAVEAELAEAARTWRDRLERQLLERRGEAVGRSLHRRYAEAFPMAYREAYDARTGSSDVDRVEEVLASGELGVDLYRPEGGEGRQVRCKVLSSGSALPLSDVVPLFEDLGFRVVAERPFEVKPAGAEASVWIRDFELLTRDGAEIDPGQVGESIQETFSRVWAGEVESDAFNRLVLVGLSWREVVVLRAYCKFLRQTGTALSQRYMAQTLVRNPEVARLLVRLFTLRFDPEGGKQAAAAAAAMEEKIRCSLDAVTNLDEDRILRRFLNLIRHTLRTNYFQTAPGGGPKPYLSFKLDSPRLQGLPKPRPRFEIFVYSPRVEAVHLRGGPVARGGIRWSDRREDFRSEILGLMKAQMVKNAVIVPVGAKGGFVVKRPPADRQALQAEGVECYKALVRGLLDLTDNYRDGAVVPPPRVVRRDGDDPYLVVAADKGTATFSDIANAVAAEYGFWLGDAFASGGSAGYDHKKMGITARGAWESVKRHFRELGKDIQSQDFTVVGVGDMSGDVFGNGMLLSPHIRLVGAFNHLHIFIDPEPDAAASFAERKRLFEMPRSTWRDYDAALISPGGGVFDRGAKAIPVAPEMGRLLGLEKASVTPAELIRALLRAPVDLLWFGGIGTYVKASAESHAQVGDRANDAVRVDAPELRAKVVGEGANLGVTQRGRIEVALAGGRINTDAIDNSGGVDCSDHEVNIKILLNGAVQSGELAGAERDRLLEEMTGEVAALVLRHNDLQTQAITVAESEAPAALDRHARMIRELERAGQLDRALEALPDDEALGERQAAGRGLTRPEIAVLLAYSKISLFQELLDSDLPDDPLLGEDLALYFPEPLRRRFADGIRNHRLRREIIATFVTNSMVNRVGPTFFRRIAAATGAGASDIARAYTVARDAFELRSLWAAIEGLDNRVPAAVQVGMIRESKRLVERATLWLLRQRYRQIPEFTAAIGPGVHAVAAAVESLLAGSDLAAFRRRQRRYEKEGVPGELAHRVASLEALASALDLVRIASRRRRPVEEVGRVYFLLGSRFHLDWLRGAARGLAAESSWHRDAATALVEELFAVQSELACRVLETAGEGTAAKAAVEAFSARNESLVQRSRELLAEVKSAGTPDLAMLTVARHQLAELVAG